MCEKHLDDRLGAVAVAELPPGLNPEPFMGWGERAGGAGSGQRCGRQHRSGLESEDLEVVVQHQHLVALAGPTMRGDHLGAVEHVEGLGADAGLDTPTDIAGRDRVERSRGPTRGSCGPRDVNSPPWCRTARRATAPASVPRARHGRRPRYAGARCGADRRGPSPRQSSSLSSTIDATCGTGTRWRRRNRPTSDSTPPFSWLPLMPGWQKKLSKP